MTDKRKSQYSWKSPWAFRSFHRMRRTLTERYVYKKLGILERHSTFKKPYKRRLPHRLGELYFSYRGWPILPPGGSGPIPGGPGGVPGCAGAPMACFGGMLDCQEGGCDIITCLCGVPPFTVTILDDPTGTAQGIGGFFPKVCIDSDLYLDLEYGEVLARVEDSVGNFYITHHPLVDCAPCCETFTVTGDATINPNSIWLGVIDPPCPDATITAVSNSGCTHYPTVIDNGATARVPVGTPHCGTVTVTVTSPTDMGDCSVLEATFVFRINDTGQGGDWIYLSSGASGCTDCNQCDVDQAMSPCIAGEFKYGKEDGVPLAEGKCDADGYNSCCYTIDPGNWPCEAADGNPPPCNAPGCGNCTGEVPGNGYYYECCSFMWRKCEWKCSC